MKGRTVNTPMIFARQVGCPQRMARPKYAKKLGASSWKDLRSAALSCFTMKRSSRVLAKKLLLLPPRGSHLHQASRSALQSSAPSLHQLLCKMCS